jgi:hypothetical protein
LAIFDLATFDLAIFDLTIFDLIIFDLIMLVALGSLFQLAFGYRVWLVSGF